jgi:hypothetical protein
MAVMIIQTFRPQNLGDAILLVQKRLLVHLVQQTTLAIPAGDRLQVLHSLLLRPNITHLYHDQGILVRGSSGEEHIRIELPGCLLHTVTEVLDQRRGGRFVEPTVRNGMVSLARTVTEMNHELEKVSCKHHGDRERSCDVPSSNTEAWASTFDCPPEI